MTRMCQEIAHVDHEVYGGEESTSCLPYRDVHGTDASTEKPSSSPSLSTISLSILMKFFIYFLEDQDRDFHAECFPLYIPLKYFFMESSINVKHYNK